MLFTWSQFGKNNSKVPYILFIVRKHKCYEKRLFWISEMLQIIDFMLEYLKIKIIKLKSKYFDFLICFYSSLQLSLYLITNHHVDLSINLVGSASIDSSIDILKDSISLVQTFSVKIS